MSTNNKIIILFIILLFIIAALTYIAISGFELFGIKVMSVSNIKEKVKSTGTINMSFETMQAAYDNKLQERIKAEKEFESQKAKYSTISDDTIALIKDVTKDQKYMIEYLWIVLGDYAADNNLKLIVMEPNQMATFNIDSGVVAIQEAKATNETAVTTPTGTTVSSDGTTKEANGGNVINPTTDASTVKILLVGKYQDVADFVFEVENDKSLKFKLDNISMTYAGSNSVLAQFDVLGMSVLLK